MHPNMDKWIIPVYGPRPVTLSRLFAKATRSHYSCLSLCLTLMMDSLLPIWAFLDLWLGQPCAKIIHPCTWGVCCVVHAEHCHSQVQGVFPVGCVEGVHGSSDRQSGGHPTTAHRVPHAQSASQSCPESCSLKQSHFEDQMRVRTPHSPGIGLSPGCHYSTAASHSAHLCTVSPCARPQVWFWSHWRWQRSQFHN